VLPALAHGQTGQSAGAASAVEQGRHKDPVRAAAPTALPEARVHAAAEVDVWSPRPRRAASC
jgi:hypothetical protein